MASVFHGAGQEAAIDEFCKKVEELRLECVERIADAVIEGLKKKYPQYADDDSILCYAFHREHPMRGDTYYAWNTRIGPAGLSSLKALGDETNPARWITEYSEVVAVIHRKIGKNDSEQVQKSVDALVQWCAKYQLNPFDWDRTLDEKRMKCQYRVGFCRCYKHEYDELAPHLDLLRIVKNLESSKPEKRPRLAKNN